MKLNQLLLCFFYLFAISCKKDNPVPNPPTSTEQYKGVFGLRNATKLNELGADYTRIIVWDTDLKSIYAQVDNGVKLGAIPEFNQVKAIHDIGVKIILTLRWPDQNSSDPHLYDRVPRGQDSVESIALLKRFLTDFGPIIEIYSLQNEIGGLGPGTYAEADMMNSGSGSPAVQWWKALAQTFKAEQAQNDQLSHIHLSSPCPVLLKRLVFNPQGLPKTNIDFFYETVEFGNSTCDYIDFHFNTFTLAEYSTALDFIKPMVKKPMIATEWSEVGSANDYVTLAISNELRTKSDSLGYTLPGGLVSNDDLITHLYNSPCPMALWEYMVSESGYEPDFMKQSSQQLYNAGFKILCWNSGYQEGLTAYDLRSFYATMTVSSPLNELVRFTQEFKAF